MLPKLRVAGSSPVARFVVTEISAVTYGRWAKVVSRNIALFVVSMIGLAACGNSGTGAALEVDSDGDGFPDLVDACPNEPETLNGVYDGDGCPDTPAQFYEDVRTDVEMFWASELGGGQFQYRLITEFTAYTDAIDTPCGLVELNSASYCTTNEGVYYDSDFLQFFLDEIGDFAPAFIISHEIGHHVSNIFGWDAPSVISVVQLELQADCFAGAWVTGASARGLLQPADEDETLEALILSGDPADTWFDPDLHGTSDQRLIAFLVGVFQGGGPCTSPDFFALFPAPSE